MSPAENRFFRTRDDRPRIHLWRGRDGGWSMSRGPTGSRLAARSAGEGLDLALRALGDDARDGAVIFVEPAELAPSHSSTERQSNGCL